MRKQLRLIAVFCWLLTPVTLLVLALSLVGGPTVGSAQNQQSVLPMVFDIAYALALAGLAYMTFVNVCCVIAWAYQDTRNRGRRLPLSKTTGRILGIALTTSVVLPAHIASAQTAWGDAPTIRNVGATEPTEPSETGAVRKHDQEQPAASPQQSVEPLAAPASELPTDHEDNEHTVRLGENLWSIAASNLKSQGTEPNSQTLRNYWKQLVDLNQSRLVDPTNPDLILPGQQLRLPNQ